MSDRQASVVSAAVRQEIERQVGEVRNEVQELKLKTLTNLLMLLASALIAGIAAAIGAIVAKLL